MFKRMISKKLDAFQTEWNYDMDYAREVLELGPMVLKRFFDATEIGKWSGTLPDTAHVAAKIVGVMAGDCGPCVQLVVNMARSEGVDPEILEAVVAGNDDALPPEVALVTRFARALVTRSGDLPHFRDRVREAYGTAGLVAVAYGIIQASMYPTLKYALGHGHSCAKIEIGSHTVIPASATTEQTAAGVTEVA